MRVHVYVCVYIRHPPTRDYWTFPPGVVRQHPWCCRRADRFFSFRFGFFPADQGPDLHRTRSRRTGKKQKNTTTTARATIVIDTRLIIISDFYRHTTLNGSVPYVRFVWSSAWFFDETELKWQPDRHSRLGRLSKRAGRSVRKTTHKPPSLHRNFNEFDEK